METELRFPPRSVPPELEVLLCCARRELDGRSLEVLRRHLASSLPWQSLRAAADQHRLTPLLHHHIANSAHDAAPPGLLRELRDAFATNAHRSLQQTAELRNLVETFSAAGIRTVPYKGPLLAQQLYGSIALRQMGDLDVLVSARDARAARELLVEHGYQSPLANAGIPDDVLFSSDCNLVLVDPARRLIVELHWAFAAGRYAFPLSFNDAWNRSAAVQFAGIEVRAFSSDDLLLILCFHGARHMWERIEWIAGVAELLRSHTFDWDAVTARAAQLGCRRALMLGLLLAATLLGGPVPADVLRRDRRDVERLAAVVWSSFVEQTTQLAHNRGRPFHQFQLDVQDDVRRRIRYLWHAALDPSKDEYLSIPLPRGMRGLYPLLRPIRLAGRYARPSRHAG